MAKIAATVSRIAGGLRSHFWAIASLLALVVVVYWPTLGYDFVNWDDPWYVYENPLIQSWSPWNLYQIATSVVIRNYAPLTIFSYLLDHTFFGMWAGGFHLTNFLLHALNAVLVFFLIRQLTGNRIVAWMTAALFAVHPVHIESVAWIASRKGLLSGAFILATFLCWLRPQRTSRQEATGVVFLLLALLSKIIAVVVPAIVLLYDILVRRDKFADAFARQVVPGFLALCMLLINMSAQTSELGGVRGHLELSKAHILAVDSIILWRYVGMLIYPHDLCVLYDPPTSGIIGWVAMAVAGWLVVTCAVYRRRRSDPLVFLAAIATLLFLLPVLNLFPLTTLMNDRYLYLPSIPLFAVAAGGLYRLVCWRFPEEWIRQKYTPMLIAGRRLVGAGVLMGALIGCWIANRGYLPVWKNGLSLWQHTVQHVPQLSVVQIQLANTLHLQGRDLEAVRILEEALQSCQPDSLDRRRILKKLGQWQQQ